MGVVDLQRSLVTESLYCQAWRRDGGDRGLSLLAVRLLAE
jgi:hypothetical protein